MSITTVGTIFLLACFNHLRQEINLFGQSKTETVIHIICKLYIAIKFMKCRSIPFSMLLLSFMILSSCGDTSTSVTDPGGNDDDPDPPPPEFSHTEAPGASNEAFITGREYDRLVLEIQYMPGSKPEPESIENLRTFLEQHLDKGSITISEPVEIPSGNLESYTPGNIRDLEQQHRQQFTEGSTLASYAIFVDGPYQKDNVLGIAYYNTSTAYFSETIQGISGGVGQPSKQIIETTVFNHEFGHLMGLVNNGTDMQDDHHDSSNGAHCTVEECLMYFSVNTSDFFANLFGGSIPVLQDFCVADIEALQ